MSQTKTMHTLEHIQLADWSDFADDLRSRLINIKFNRIICIRNYSARDVPIALKTGTDRTGKSFIWSEQGFDHDHKANPSGKEANEITYVHRIRWQTRPFTVLNLGGEFTTSYEDLTETLDEGTAISVYDSAGLDRVASNEHWFNRDPLQVLLYVYSIKEDADE
ncbi:UNVERIFIED_ORG: hypothetical protein J2W74_002016 [Methylorubrum zatmanii]